MLRRAYTLLRDSHRVWADTLHHRAWRGAIGVHLDLAMEQDQIGQGGHRHGIHQDSRPRGTAGPS